MTGNALVERFTACVEEDRFDELTELYTADAVFDAHVPDWRFQVLGPRAITQQLKGWFQLPGRFHDVQVHDVAAGDLLVRFEWREREDTAESIVSREMQLWRLHDGRIAEQVVFCAGRWDRLLVEQMSADAPLARPATAPARHAEGTAVVVDAFNAAFQRHDVDSVMALMTEDCVFEDTTPPDGVRHQGEAEVRRCWEELFANSPDAFFTTEEQVVAGDRAVVRWHYRWTQDGRGHVRGIDFVRVRDGKVAEKHSYVKG